MGNMETHRAFKRSTIPCTAQVSHCPERRPEAEDVVDAREHDGREDHAAGEAELVPRRHHAALEVQVVGFLAAEGDLEGAVAGGDRRRVVPFHVVRHPVVKVDGLPVGVVSGVERTALDVELVAEDQLPGLAGEEVGVGVCILRRVEIDEAPVAGYGGELAGGINPA